MTSMAAARYELLLYRQYASTRRAPGAERQPAPTGCVRVVLVPRARLCRLAWAALSRPASAGSLHLFCFLVSARRPHAHPPLVSRPLYVKGGESGKSASTADQSDDVGRRPFVGCTASDCKRNGGLGADDAQRRRGSRTAAPRITSTPDSTTHRWSAGAAAPAPRVVARARACAG